MAKKLVKVSLALKLRILFGAAVLAIIAAGLTVPWHFMELLAAQGVQRPASELSRLRLNEFLRDHPDPTRPKGKSDLAVLYTLMVSERGEGRRGPDFIALKPRPPAEGALDAAALDARNAFLRNSGQELAILPSEDERGRSVYRCFRPVRVESTCVGCHGPTAVGNPQFQPGELVGMIDLSMPASAPTSGPLVWLTQAAFVGGGALAALCAFFLFTAITHSLILRPLRQLRDASDKVAEGNLTVQCGIRTGDELQRVAESFNEMVAAIAQQHEKLRAANRALDLKLSELAEANVALAQANTIKTEFLTNISHELRTPLTSILGFADLVQAAEDPKIRRYGQNVSSAAKSLLSMINDLLDLVKMEAGKAGVRRDKVSVTEACQTLLTLMAPQAEQKKLQVHSELAEEVPLVLTDAGKLQQVLYNLLSNAIKFTPAGGRVTLRTFLAPGERDGRPAPEVGISVADTGPGIAESDQKHVFDKFYQVGRSLTKETPGTGLGLSIARELTALLGGRLTLKSSPGHGAEFTVWLPVEPEPPPTGEAKA